MRALRLTVLLLAFAVTLYPACVTYASPPKPIPVAQNAFAVTHDGWAGYQTTQWYDNTWKFHTYAGLWAVGAFPEHGDPVAWAKGRIAAEIVGVPGLEMEEGLLQRAALAANQKHAVEIKFRHDPKAAHPRVTWEDKSIVVVFNNPDTIGGLSDALLKAVDVAANYDLHPGWVTGSFFRTIASPVEHPIDAAAVAKNLNCDWMIFSYGQNDDLTVAHANKMLDAVTPKGSERPMLILRGQRIRRGPWHWTKEGWSINIIGSDNFFDYQDINKELKYYVDGARDGGGTVFAAKDTFDKVGAINAERKFKRPLFFDGIDGVDPERVKTTPFLGGGDRTRPRGKDDTSGPNAMVVLTPRGKPLTQATLMEGIKAKRAFHISGGTNFQGPPALKRAMGLLLLSRSFLEDYFQSDLVVEAKVEGWKTLHVTVTNNGTKPFAGGLQFHLPLGQTAVAPRKRGTDRTMLFQPGETRKFPVTLGHAEKLSGKDYTIRVTVSGKDGSVIKETLARVSYPRFVSGYQTLYLPPGPAKIPFTIWNGSDQEDVPWSANDPKFPAPERVKGIGLEPKPLEPKERIAHRGQAKIPVGTHKRVDLSVTLTEGVEDFTFNALGSQATTRVVVRKQAGAKIKHWEEDLNKDGKNEIFFENDHIKGAILLQGGRMIRLWNKQNGDSVFSEIWPENPPERDKKTDRSFWPYGGLEEFISYPKIHGHTWFTAKIVRDDAQALAIELTATVHGQTINKTYTMYAGSGLVELRYALEFDDESTHIVGVNPILALGEAADAHDVSFIPMTGGVVEHRFDPDRMHGGRYDTNAGWIVHYDEREKSGFIESFPLADTLFMHLWNNTPQNGATKYYYTELQPWFLIDHNTTTYYSCHFLPHQGDWRAGLKALRELGIKP